MSQPDDGAIRHALIIDGGGISVHDSVDIAVEAERAGFDSVWHAEEGREPWVPLAAMATATSRVRLGTAIALIARPPMFMEQAAANLDDLSGGRHVLGLGTGPEFRSHDWHGQDWSRPVRRMREYVEVLREMWTAHSGKQVTYTGQRLQVKEYSRANPPLRERIPIVIGGSGPNMLALAGEVGDAVIFDMLTTPLVIGDYAKAATEVGLERSGRRWDDIDRGCLIITAVNEDRSVAVDLARHQIAYYMRFPQLDELLEMHGLLDEAAPVIAARERKDHDAMLAGVSDRLVETLALVGTPEEARRRLADWTRYVNMPLLFSPVWRLERQQIIDNHLAITAAFAR